MWWMIGVFCAILLPILMYWLTVWASKAVRRMDPVVADAYLSTLEFTVPLCIPLGFLIGAVIGYKIFS